MFRETTLKPQRGQPNFSHKPESVARLLRLLCTLSSLIKLLSPKTSSLPDFYTHKVDKVTLTSRDQKQNKGTVPTVSVNLLVGWSFEASVLPDRLFRTVSF